MYGLDDERAIQRVAQGATGAIRAATVVHALRRNTTDRVATQLSPDTNRPAEKDARCRQPTPRRTFSRQRTRPALGR